MRTQTLARILVLILNSLILSYKVTAKLSLIFITYTPDKSSLTCVNLDSLLTSFLEVILTEITFYLNREHSLLRGGAEHLPSLQLGSVRKCLLGFKFVSFKELCESSCYYICYSIYWRIWVSNYIFRLRKGTLRD